MGGYVPLFHRPESIKAGIPRAKWNGVGITTIKHPLFPIEWTVAINLYGSKQMSVLRELIMAQEFPIESPRLVVTVNAPLPLKKQKK